MTGPTFRRITQNRTEKSTGTCSVCALIRELNFSAGFRIRIGE